MRSAVPKSIPIVVVALALSGCISINRDVVVADGETVEGITSINNSIRVGVGSTVDGKIETVNGSVFTSEGSQTGRIETVNGKMEIGPESVTEGLETVNGAIQLAERVMVEGDVETLNGRITIGEGSKVTGEVSAVNGQVVIRGAEVGSLVNVRGGMILESGTVVNGELRIRKPRLGDPDPVTVEIYNDVRVAGPLVFERPVNLRIHESATVGEIEGAEPVYFSD